MDSKVNEQIKRVNILSKMINERLLKYQQEQEDYEKWQKENPDEYWYDWNSERVYKSEIKRLMLILRQETIELGKML